jgi:hypothetical protein
MVSVFDRATLCQAQKFGKTKKPVQSERLNIYQSPPTQESYLPASHLSFHPVNRLFIHVLLQRAVDVWIHINHVWPFKDTPG